MKLPPFFTLSTSPPSTNPESTPKRFQSYSCDQICFREILLRDKFLETRPPRCSTRETFRSRCWQNICHLASIYFPMEKVYLLSLLDKLFSHSASVGNLLSAHSQNA